MYYRIAEEGNGFKLVGSQDEKNDPKNYIGQANYSYNNTWISNGNMAWKKPVLSNRFEIAD